MMAMWLSGLASDETPGTVASIRGLKFIALRAIGQFEAGRHDTARRLVEALNDRIRQELARSVHSPERRLATLLQVLLLVVEVDRRLTPTARRSWSWGFIKQLYSRKGGTL
jgi:hypothetical protein